MLAGATSRALSAHGPLGDVLFAGKGPDRTQQLELFVTDRLRVERSRRFHEEERQHLQHVVLHDVTHRAGGLRERLDEVRGSIAAGSRSVLGEYVAAVHDQISLEHRQWLEGAENMRAAVARLEKALNTGASEKAVASSEGVDHKD